MPSRVWHQGTLPASAAAAIEVSVGIVCLMLPWIFPGCCVIEQGHSCSRVRPAVRRGMSMPSELETLIDAINVELEAGDWARGVTLTTALYAGAMAEGEGQLAEVIQDLHWIANDALVDPMDVPG